MIRIILDMIAEAWGELWRARMRTTLALLGIIIGAAALTFPAVLYAAIGNMIARTHEHTWIVAAVPPQNRDPLQRKAHLRRKYFLPADIEAVRKGCPYLEKIAVSSFPGMGADYPTFKAGREWCNGMLEGKDNAIPEQMAEGRFFSESESENAARVVLINQSLQRKLFKGRKAVDSFMRVNGERFRVIGVKEKTAFDVAPTAIIPANTMQQVNPDVSWSFSILPKPHMAAIAKRSVDAILISRMGDPGDTFFWQAGGVGSGFSEMRLFTFLGLIGLLTLLSAGVALSNKTYIDVLERINHIALRRAIGATIPRIYATVMLESVLLCGVGCLFGGGLGWSCFALLTKIANENAPPSAQIGLTPSIAPIAGIYLFVISLGVMAGLQAAAVAARANPAEILTRKEVV
jgi:putative ABC transport system permease protein